MGGEQAQDHMRGFYDAGFAELLRARTRKCSDHDHGAKEGLFRRKGSGSPKDLPAASVLNRIAQYYPFEETFRAAVACGVQSEPHVFNGIR